MKSKIYFYKNLDDLKSGVNKFFEIISKDLGKDDIGLKIHFGDKNNDTHINPQLLKNVTKYFRNPRFVECNSLYKGSRTCRTDHIKIAKEHGFNFLDIDILDGELGEETIEVPIKTKNTKSARLGKGLTKYNKLIALTHFKGHRMTGFGGAFKNIGMGLGSRSGKLDMHSSISPESDEKICTGCGVCKKNCGANAIKMVNGKSRVDQKKCVGCAMCIAVCPTQAMKAQVESDSRERLMEKIAEYTLAVIKNRKLWYINFLTNITYQCDCHQNKQKSFMKDIGILLSKDPVAIDKASLDLVIKNNNGVDPFKKKYGIDGVYIINYAEKLGLGTKNYEIEIVD